jgi:hypothetical protein
MCVGAVAHVRYGSGGQGNRGSIFSAVVQAVNGDGTWDVRYEEDGVVVRAFPYRICGVLRGKLLLFYWPSKMLMPVSEARF